MAEHKDIYYCDARLDSALKTLHESKISSTDKKDIENFIASMQALGIKKIRLIKNVIVLRFISQGNNKPFREATKNDCEKMIAKIENNKDYAAWTKADYKTVLKRFYKWLLGNDEYYPDCIKWLKIKSPNDTQLPEDLITEEELLKVVSYAQSPRDKCLIFMLFESGGRIGEILPLRIKDIHFGEQITSIQVNGKTGQRRIPLVSSTNYLSTWLNMHPLKDNPDAPLWIKLMNRPSKGKGRPLELGNVQALSYSGVKKILETAFERAGVKKKHNAHQFRHARATDLANKLTEAQMKEYFGWTQSSDMAARYVHMSGRNVDDAILAVNGLKPKEDIKESKLKPKVCSRCNEKNPPNASYCFRCAMPLNVETVQKEALENKVKENALLEYMKSPEEFFNKMRQMEKQINILQKNVKK
ncbi:MAG: site-specific integrase [archaeon]|jgi:integrase